MLAYAMHHPDGMHGKQFDFSGWLHRHGFTRASSTGKMAYGGTYADSAGRTIIVNPKSGPGDVVATVGSSVISAECKASFESIGRHGRAWFVEDECKRAAIRVFSNARPVGA